MIGVRRLVGIALVIMLTSHVAGLASDSNAISDSLPIEVQVDLLMTELSNLIKEGNNQGIIEIMPKIRALNIEIPDSLFFMEAQALQKMGQALQARDRLLVYLRRSGRDGRYYQAATGLLLQVKEEAEEQEKLRVLEEKKRAQELAQSAEKAQLLRAREVQENLHQVGFWIDEINGKLDKPTREAIAVYQVRRDLKVNGKVNSELITQLQSEVPEYHNCDTLAGYSRVPGKQGVKISRIVADAAISACEKAYQTFPHVIRFQVAYARSLIAADRPEDAIEELKNAVQLGYPAAQMTVAWIHYNGLLSDNRPDYPEALKWYLRAADRNYHVAQHTLGDIYLSGRGARRDLDLAVEWYRKAAISGYAPAQVDLAKLYEAGRGVSRNYPVAMDWYRKAADSHYVHGEFSLAAMYERGKGVKKDKETALAWYKKAAAQGHAEAKAKSKRLAGRRR